MDTDTLENIIQAALPELRIALADALSGNMDFAFNIAEGTNSQTGARTSFVCFIVHEYAAIVLQAALHGMAASSQKMTADMTAAREANQPKRPSIILPV